MLSVRPTATPFHLRRTRLLERMPDEPGFMVWLEAPYGYGKSVLAGQWAEELEGDGWRVAWLALAGRDPRALLAQRLSLPAAAPWGIIDEELWREPTLLVLEDLQGSEDLAPILQHHPGLVLLASRGHLPYLELPKLRTQGRLLHLTSEQLAFQEDEAAELFEDRERGHEAWRLTRGWSLPLHFAALTGDLPQQATLLEGVKRSVSERAWRELMFLATVDFLPKQAAVAATGDLARSGFLQTLTDGYRLHPLIAESVLGAHDAEVNAALGEQAHRLEPARRGEACERARFLTGLREVLIGGDGATVALNVPEAFLRWDAAVPPSPELERRAHATLARLTLGRFEDALDDARELATNAALAPRLRSAIASQTLSGLGGVKRFAQAAEFSAVALDLLDELAPQEAGAILRGLGLVAFAQGDYPEAERSFRAALAKFQAAEAGEQQTTFALVGRANLASTLWELHGDPHELLAMIREVASAPGLDDGAFVTFKQNLAVAQAFVGDEAGALEATRAAATKARDYGAVVVNSMLAYFEGGTAAFRALLAGARKWERFELSERVSALWLRALRRAGDLDAAIDLQEVLEVGPFTKLELVWAYERRGDRARARELLEQTRGAYPYREFRLHWHAAAYLVERTHEQLDAILELSTNREGMLIYTGVPLTALPQDRPELARAYPLAEVLASGWTEAIRLRLGEVPPLEVKVLGEVSVDRLGEPVPLTDRQRELVTLLALGVGREAIAEEMWPGTDQKKQRNNLGVQLNMLRKLLEPWGVTTYLLESGLTRFESDHARLEAALGRGDTETVTALYRGPLAPGVDGDTVVEERLNLHERVLDALLAGAEANASADVSEPDGTRRVEDAVRYLKRLLELEPMHEEAVQVLLGLLMRLGRRRDAQRTLERFAQLLRQETGLEPQPSTLALLDKAEGG
ncbi:MAG: hypothetical protein IT345_14435 [Trueperaceae bacterium]|nr:hypothetical protein [Trueperaceae bacterium]